MTAGWTRADGLRTFGGAPGRRRPALPSAAAAHVAHPLGATNGAARAAPLKALMAAGRRAHPARAGELVLAGDLLFL